MKQEILEILQHCYLHSPSIVQIMDWHWHPLWCNREGLLIDDLPRHLGVAMDYAQNATLRFSWNRSMYECRLLCNRVDGYRIAELSPVPDYESASRMDVETIAASIQSMHSACHTLYAELEEHELYDQTPLLNILMGNCYRIYRMAFLQKEIDRLSSGKRSTRPFLVNARMKKLYDKLRSILRSCAEVELEPCTEQVCLQGDAEEFTMAMLCAILLCYRDKRHFQHIRMALIPGDGEATVRLTVTRGAELPPNVQGMNSIDVTTDDGEKAILNLFCSAYGGRWLLAENHSEQSVCCTLTFRSNAPTGDLVLFSPEPEREPRFYNQYETLLSRICYRNMF